jgi:hypothetical protein
MTKNLQLMSAVCVTLFTTLPLLAAAPRVLREERIGLTATAFAQELSGCVFTFLNLPAVYA